jgi:hypothetical protein
VAREGFIRPVALVALGRARLGAKTAERVKIADRVIRRPSTFLPFTLMNHFIASSASRFLGLC